MFGFEKKLAIGSDHAGIGLKKFLADRFGPEGYSFADMGTYSVDSVDYPDFAVPVCRAVQEGNAGFGVLVCGTGNGMSMAANRFAGIRAAICWSQEIARLARLHNDANVLVLPGRFLSEEEAAGIFHVFMITEFEGGRHIPRIRKIDDNVK